jgi:hypothetical protein
MGHAHAETWAVMLNVSLLATHFAPCLRHKSSTN